MCAYIGREICSNCIKHSFQNIHKTHIICQTMYAVENPYEKHIDKTMQLYVHTKTH